MTGWCSTPAPQLRRPRPYQAPTTDRPQSDATASSPANPRAAAAASTDDPQLEVDNITGFSAGFPPGPELGTVNDNELWGADFGVLD